MWPIGGRHRRFFRLRAGLAVSYCLGEYRVRKKPQCLSLVAKMLLQNARVFNPVHVAAYHTGNFNMIRLLLERGADPNLADEYGNTPLRYATDHTNIVNRLSK